MAALVTQPFQAKTPASNARRNQASPTSASGAPTDRQDVSICPGTDVRAHGQRHALVGFTEPSFPQRSAPVKA